MVQPGIGLDTPRTNLGDATYLSHRPDLDITQEPSFQSPSKEPNVFQSQRNGAARPSLRTPRGNKNRAPFNDRINIPNGLGGGEFTPLLKSATRNSARRRSGKENGLVTPALGKIDEDMTPLHPGESSMYRSSREPSFLDRTPLPDADSDSTATTPLIMRRGKAGTGGPLHDGQQLSLREQENVIDKIEKENFGLKLKIHFLEDALRKTGPGFSEAALKENTELKVDKVTMQRELQRYKKYLTSAEKDLETYREQLAEMQELAKRKQGSHDHSTELDKLQRDLEDKEADIEDLQQQLRSDRENFDKVEKLQDEIGDLEAELREKERAISDRDDELDTLKAKVRQTDERSHDEVDKLRDEIEDLQADIQEKDRIINEREDNLEDLQARVQQAEDRAKNAQIRMIELEEKAQASGKLREARETIEDLEANARDLERQVEDMKEKLEEAQGERELAEANLEELQEEMANKSVVTKGLPRQLEEKVVRLQDEVETVRHEYETLDQKFNDKQREIDDLRFKLKESRQERDASENQRRSLATRMEELKADLNARSDEKNLLQTRHDALTAESASLQRDVARLQKTVSDVQGELERERQHAMDIEKDIRVQYRVEIEKLNNEISDLQAEVRERENLYDNDSEKWETERHNLESERSRAEERVLGLQKTIEKLRQAEGSLNNKESKLQEALQSETERHHNEEAVLSRQIDDLQEDLSSRQQMLEDLRNELSAVRDELRQAQLDNQTEVQKVEGLEDEVEVLQATLDEESEKSAQEIEALAKECDDLRRELRDLRRSSESARANTDSSRQTADLNAKAIERLEKQVDEYRLSLSKATQEKRSSDRECGDLRQQLNELRRLTDSAKASTSASRDAAEFNARTIERLEKQVTDYKSDLVRAQKDKADFQEQLSKVKIELHSVSSRLAETEAERDEIDAELQRSKKQDDTFQIDQERITLRATKVRLEHEIRRLKEENRSLTEQRDSLEKTIEDELDKAEAEEDRLNQEIISLKTKATQLADNQDALKARRTIRDLERKIEDYQLQLAQATIPIDNLDGNSELSLIKRDLSAARKKELDFMQKESDHKSVVRGLKRQIGDLERRIHEADISRLVQSPSDNASARKAEISELRHQLSVAHQSIHDLKKSLRDSERNAASMEQEVRQRLDEVEDDKMALEQALLDAEQAADEAYADLQEATEKYKSKADKYKKERDSMANKLADARRKHVNDTITSVASTADSEMTREERHDLYEILRKTQIDADALEREVREHKEALTELAELEKSLRVKLDRARSERAQYRSDVEKLQREMKSLNTKSTDVVKLQQNIKSLKRAKKDAEAIAKAAMAQASVARARFTVSTFPPVNGMTSNGKERDMDLSTQYDILPPQSSNYQPPRVVEVEDDADEEDEDDLAVGDDNAARVIHFKDDNDTQMHTDTIVRAAEAAERQHLKQMRSMAVQMEWMQARWQRELRLRDDAAFAKQFLISEMNIKDQVNEHDLLKLETLTKQLRLKHQINFPNLPIATSGQTFHKTSSTPAKAFKRATNAVRFMVRLQIAAREWRKQEELRKVLVSKWDEYEKHPVVAGGIKKPATTFAPPVVNGGGIKKPVPTFAPAPAFFGGAGIKKPVAATTATSSSKFTAFVKDVNKRKRNGEDSELDEVESSAAPLEFDIDSSSREREERMAQDYGELDGTEAFSVDSM
ncbi:hypothetical protein N0V82_007704 [Gnomoniopsis sp. IMI 355080]|nr:hypothetical protein N0V82_007704 [Gnomoniopsis sp. IMI 355080]